MTDFLLPAVFSYFIAAVLFIVFLPLIRKNSGTEVKKNEGGGSKKKIFMLFLASLAFPIISILGFFFGAMYVLGLLGKNHFFSKEMDAFIFLPILAALSLSGFPFFIRMIRLFRDDTNAVLMTVFFLPYGLIVWMACFFLVALMFYGGSC